MGTRRHSEERRRRGALFPSCRRAHPTTGRGVGKQLDKMRTAIDQQPGSVDAFKAAGDTIINASGLSEQDKAAQRDWWKNNASPTLSQRRARTLKQLLPGSARRAPVTVACASRERSRDPNAGAEHVDGAQLLSVDGRDVEGRRELARRQGGRAHDGRARQRCAGRREIRIFTAQNADKRRRGGFEASERTSTWRTSRVRRRGRLP